MSKFEITRVVDHSDEIRRRVENVKEAILTEWGTQGSSYVSRIITKESRVDTGAMRDDVSPQVSMSESAVYIGTAVEYAIFHEYGTGIYLEGGGGRQTPWFYVDNHGEGHWTRGIKPIHMFKNGISQNIDKFKKMANDKLDGEF